MSNIQLGMTGGQPPEPDKCECVAPDPIPGDLGDIATEAIANSSTIVDAIVEAIRLSDEWPHFVTYEEQIRAEYWREATGLILGTTVEQENGWQAEDEFRVSGGHILAVNTDGDFYPVGNECIVFIPCHPIADDILQAACDILNDR